MKIHLFPPYLIILTALSACGGLGVNDTTDVTNDEINSNSSPFISGTAPSTISEGEHYRFVPIASDPEGSSLLFSIANKPAWLAFDTASGELNGTPSSGDVDVYSEILISVSDGELQTSMAPFSITVERLPVENLPPSITGTPLTETYENQLYSFTPIASDPESDELIFSINNPPVWLNFNPTTGTLSGVPNNEDTGQYFDIVITVTDNISTVSLAAFDITVRATPPQNLPPLISGDPPQDARENQIYEFLPVATDPENDDLTFTIHNQPAWLNFDSTTGMLTGVPTTADVGVYLAIEITVNDSESITSLPSFDITVHATSATLSWVAPVTRADDSPLPAHELGGYNIYAGTDPENLVLLVSLPDANTTVYKDTDLPPGTYYYAVTAYNTEEAESSFSQIVSKTIQ